MSQLRASLGKANILSVVTLMIIPFSLVGLQVPVVPMIHGTNKNAVQGIVNAGFGTVAKVDDGYYGQGFS